MAKNNPALEGTYFSEATREYTILKLKISSADYDTGAIKGCLLSVDMADIPNMSGGYHRESSPPNSTKISVTAGDCRLDLRADDYAYKKLYGTLLDSATNKTSNITFNKR
ncbi:hypothetical protein [Pseudomonas kitaguniensis]|uniref:hypothetical protein n=1 Tax=Pseudomonas kitaguniensis TaxID=2607908 RepID=UPI003BA1F7BA